MWRNHYLVQVISNFCTNKEALLGWASTMNEEKRMLAFFHFGILSLPLIIFPLMNEAFRWQRKLFALGCKKVFLWGPLPHPP